MPRRHELTEKADGPRGKIREACLNLLTRREHTGAELKRKLLAKGFEGSAIDEVIEALAGSGWQSDARFAEEYLRRRIRQGYGPVRLEQELKRKGAETVDMEVILEELEETWESLIERVYRKKYRDLAPDSLAELGKRARFLQYRGFTSEHVNALFDRLGCRF